jgi:hypothetical protein
MKAKRFSKLKAATIALMALLGAAVWYVRANPRIFNESFFEHAHCIAQAGSPLQFYALDHGGDFPVHTNGYGDALLLLAEDDTFYFDCLTGPGFSGDVLRNAKTTGTNLDEAECGRVYVQGLRDGSNQEIAILFDKLPTPGDHCHGFARLSQPFGREVLFIRGDHQFIRNADWPAFAEKQIKLLIEAGISEPVAKSYYASLPE